MYPSQEEVGSVHNGRIMNKVKGGQREGRGEYFHYSFSDDYDFE